MMKKNFFKLMLLAIMLASAALANAHDFEVDGIYYSINYQGTKATVTYKGNSFSQYSDEYSGSVVIPASVTYNGTTYPVTSIGDYAFYGCSSLTSVYIRNSVTTIGGYAFYNCRGLTSLKVESGNTVYDSRNNCNAIIETASNTLIAGCKTTIIPNSVTSIGYNAFSGCTGLANIDIPNSVTTIGGYAFSGCSGLTSVNIGNSVTTISNNAFFYCTSLATISVASDNPKYDSRNNCNAIIETASNTLIIGCRATIIPNSVTTIGFAAFSDCTGLTSMTIPNSITTIRSGVFSDCTGLTSVDIPNSVTTIGYAAFEGCSGLTSVTIHKSVTSIIAYAFMGCSGLTSLKVESGNTVYDSRNNCNAIIETASNTLIFGCKTTIIPNSVTSIGDYAFYNCSGLTSLTIPNSVTKIGYSAFCSCSGLASVTCKATTPPSMENVDTFSDYTTPTLYVPTASVDAYQTTKWWKLFTNIVGVDFSTPGDVNGDGEVNISDVNAVINFILSGQATTAGDVNKDGEVNIADINAVIDIILGGN